MESGLLGLTMLEHGDMSVMRAQPAGTPAVAEPIEMSREIALFPGDWIIETAMVHKARNLTDEPTTVLVSGLIEAGGPLTVCTDAE